jgi:hypothetical protein
MYYIPLLSRQAKLSVDAAHRGLRERSRKSYMANASAEAPRGAHTTRRLGLKVLAVTLLVAVPAMALGHLLWQPQGMEPSAAQLPFFMGVSLFEALALGLGVSFLTFGLPVVRQVAPGLRLRAWLMYRGIGWALVSWWSHGNLHMSNGDNMQRLLYIEYGYHVTLIVAVAIVAYCFLSLLREMAGGRSSVR